MITCITLKNSSFKQFKIKNVDEENIYKKCGYKSSNNFNKLYTWKIDANTHLELWSKVDALSKVFNQHIIFSKFSIVVNVNNKCIFLLKNNNEYINLDSKLFNAFFDLKEDIETSCANIINCPDSSVTTNTNTNTDANTNTNTDDNADANINTKLTKNALSNLNKNEDCDANSELSYELYSYSDEESEKV